MNNGSVCWTHKKKKKEKERGSLERKKKFLFEWNDDATFVGLKIGGGGWECYVGVCMFTLSNLLFFFCTFCSDSFDPYLFIVERRMAIPFKSPHKNIEN